MNELIGYYVGAYGMMITLVLISISAALWNIYRKMK